MKRSTTEKGYAKINLLLDITGIRKDGYHLIDGVMQTVSLADLLKVEYEESKQTEVEVGMLSCNRKIDPQTNLARRAAVLYLETIGATGKVSIQIEKNIPVSSGLAGGSTDAAATLRALNRLFGGRLSREKLCALGVRLGADVPFCIRGGAMRAQGIGELLTPCAGLNGCSIVIARPDLPEQDKNTREMYGKLDEAYHRFVGYPDPAPKVEDLIRLLNNGDLSAVCGRLENVFEDIVFRTSNGLLPALKARMQEQEGALGTLMSGSGCAVYSIFQTREQAQRTCGILRDHPGYLAWVCEPISRENPIC